VSPGGGVVAGPLYDTEGIVVFDCDLREALHAKRYFDVAGHYGRADVLQPPVDRPRSSDG
jgi:nitrilase